MLKWVSHRYIWSTLVFPRYCPRLCSIQVPISYLAHSWTNHMGIQTGNRPAEFVNSIFAIIWLFYDFIRKIVFEFLILIFLILTWHGHFSYSALKTSTHKVSQAWSFLQSIIHCPKVMLFSVLQFCRLFRFWFEGFSPQTQKALWQSVQPFGQFTLHGQS